MRAACKIFSLVFSLYSSTQILAIFADIILNQSYIHINGCPSGGDSFSIRELDEAATRWTADPLYLGANPKAGSILSRRPLVYEPLILLILSISSKRKSWQISGYWK